jgi:peroxiredoxin/outer membrane lipoprotein-sorting protein
VFLAALFLTLFLQIQTPSTNSSVGSWDNQDPSTDGITQIVISQEKSGQLRVHVWGKCEPMDCDWGVAEVNSSNGLATSVFDQGFATTAMEFVLLPDGRLLVVSKSDYKDQSGFRDQDHVEFFVRGDQVGQDAESVAARALLKKVAETYQSLSAAQFESEQFMESTDRQSSTRRTSFSKAVISKPGKLRVETTGTGEPRVTISNGKTIWTFFPESNEYTAISAGKQGLGQWPAGYALLDQIREPARITGVGRVGDADCTKITMGRDNNHTRTIWIDLKTNFIRKDEAIDISMKDGGSTRSSQVFTLARMVDNLDPTIFSFDPLKTHASERSELQKNAPLTSIGTLAQEFTLRDLDGTEVRLSELRGKVIVLDFWATWCAPCRASMPTTELLHRQLKDKGVVVLGIDDEDPKDQRAFLRKFGYSFTSLVDPAKKVAGLYKVGPIPTTIVIDEEGKIRTYDVGEASYESIWETLDALRAFRY